MSEVSTSASPKTSRLARSRGALSGIMLVLLGAWGALAPFIGPSFDFAFTPDKSWTWTSGRGWYEVLPGAVAFVGGLLLLFGASRFLTLLGAWFGILAGAWFIVGPAVSTEITLGSIGHPQGSSSGLRIAEGLAFFSGLGAVILFFAATAFGRLSVVTLRDLRTAERREARRREAEEVAARESAERHGDNGRYGDDYDRDHDRDQYDREQYDREQYDREQYDRGQHDEGVPGQQQPPSPPPPGGGYHSALGYREGEQTTQYAPPSYGQQGAPPPPPGPRGTASGMQPGSDPTGADVPPEERPQ